MPPLDLFHRWYIFAPGVACTAHLIAREYNDDRHPDGRHIFLSCVCGIATFVGALIGVVLLAPLLQTTWFALSGEPRTPASYWPAFVSLKPIFLLPGLLLGTSIGSASALLLTGNTDRTS